MPLRCRPAATRHRRSRKCTNHLRLLGPGIIAAGAPAPTALRSRIPLKFAATRPCKRKEIYVGLKSQPILWRGPRSGSKAERHLSGDCISGREQCDSRRQARSSLHEQALSASFCSASNIAQGGPSPEVAAVHTASRFTRSIFAHRPKFDSRPHIYCIRGLSLPTAPRASPRDER
jgi:hypothetical protein